MPVGNTVCVPLCLCVCLCVLTSTARANEYSTNVGHTMPGHTHTYTKTAGRCSLFDMLTSVFHKGMKQKKHQLLHTLPLVLNTSWVQTHRERERGKEGEGKMKKKEKKNINSITLREICIHVCLKVVLILHSLYILPASA